MIYGILRERCRVRSSKEIIDLQAARYTRILLDTDPGIERNMALTDQTLVCRDCNQEFVFTVGEQEFYASRNLTNTPSRCPSCRAARKNQSGGGGYAGSRGGSSRSGSSEVRQMYTATCANCGNEARVPFQPRGDKPVYCSDCYQPQKVGRSSDRRSRW